MDIRIPSECKKFREDHGYKSRQAFADAIGVHYKTVQGWENEDKPAQISLDNALAICEKFDCSLDYLVGKIEQRTHDIKTACEITGLSEAAMEKIINPEILGDYHNVFSHLVEQNGFGNLLVWYGVFLYLINRINHYLPDENEKKAEDFQFNETANTFTLSQENSIEFAKKLVTDCVKSICDNEPIIPFATWDSKTGWRYPRKEYIDEESKGIDEIN